MLYPLPLEFEGSGKRTEREIYGKVKETLSHPGFENLMKPLSIKPSQGNVIFLQSPENQLSTNQNTMPDKAP